MTEHPAESGAGVCGDTSNSDWELRAPRGAEFLADSREIRRNCPFGFVTSAAKLCKGGGRDSLRDGGAAQAGQAAAFSHSWSENDKSKGLMRQALSNGTVRCRGVRKFGN